MTNPAAETAARFTVTAVVTWAGDVARTPIGAAVSRRAARRLAYRGGIQQTVAERGIWKAPPPHLAP